VKNSLKIGGVPEHFNLPCQQAMQRDVFSNEGIDLAWSYYAGGTGAMTKALASDELDIAILLTEGFVSAVDKGLKAHIAKVYIDTPLVWGIYSGYNSGIENIENVKEGKIAISRFGSGSHLMSMIHAEQRNINISEDHFTVVNSLSKAIDSLRKNETQLFYWEKFTTRPYVKSGDVNLVGEFSAPWSSFLVVASDKAMKSKPYVIKKVLDLLAKECVIFKNAETSESALINKFDFEKKEARHWLTETKWNLNYDVSLQSLQNAKSALTKINMCNPSLAVENLCAPWITLV
jgi:sulfonate transport system substrate-binding protein